MRIFLAVSPDGLLRRFEAQGHAGVAAAGSNIACAAVTALFRTAGRVCTERGRAVGGGAGSPGEMRLVVSPDSGTSSGWLRGVTDFLLRGVSDLKDEFPKEIDLRVEMTEG